MAPLPRAAAAIARIWNSVFEPSDLSAYKGSMSSIRPWRDITRRQSRQIMVGNVPVGGDAPITVQTMTNTPTDDVRATVDQIARVHRRAYVEQILAAVPESGRLRLDPDTAMSPGSGEAALRACGAVCAAVDAVMAGDLDELVAGLTAEHQAEQLAALAGDGE